MSFNIAKGQSLSNLPVIASPPPLFLMARNSNVGQSVTAVGLGLVPTLGLDSSLSFPELGWNKGSGLAVGTAEGDDSEP